MFVSEAFAGVPDGSALSSFTVDRWGGLQVISPSIGTNQTAACWVVVTNDGRFAFVTNTGSGTISSYSIAFDGSLTLLDSVAATTAAGVTTLRSVTTADICTPCRGSQGTIDAFEVNLDGTLTPLLTVGGLPIGANGMAAR